MNYTLTDTGKSGKPPSPFAAMVKMWPLLSGETMTLVAALVAMFINAAVNLASPFIIGYAIDHAIVPKDYGGIGFYSLILIATYIVGLIASYLQTRLMGGVGQRTLFKLRNQLFTKIQELPVAFFNQNKAGDLISRINNDTDKLNQFFSQSLMQFIGNIFMILGAAIFVVSINVKLGAVALLPAIGLFFFTRAISPWIRKKNVFSLQKVGGMSAEIQESLNNFKVIVAFNRRDYFRTRFEEANGENFKASVSAGIANTIFVPVYGLSANIAQILVLAYGITLIASGQFTIGLLISFITYLSRFYDPLRQMAALWASFQVALAGWDRIAGILAMSSDMTVVPSSDTAKGASLLTFKDVSFAYPNGEDVLRHISFDLQPGKTYALVGPTGGGKTTTASLMARLYDPTGGTIFLEGKDIRSYESAERSRKIGFILQEPFLFTGTVRDNILYGNEQYEKLSNEEFVEILTKDNLGSLLERFEQGLDTKVNNADTMSLGQRQLIAFMRAVLRHPALLILDEATANIDTVTEQLLEDILKKLPSSTTKVIIAHRLNTIENADDIFFVNSGEITRAGSMQHAVDMLLHGKRES